MSCAESFQYVREAGTIVRLLLLLLVMLWLGFMPLK